MAPWLQSSPVLDPAVALSKMGVSDARFTRMRDEVSTLVYWDRELDRIDDSAPEWQTRLSGLSTRLRHLSDIYCEREKIPSSSRLLRQWLFATAVCAYVCSNLEYDFEAGRKPIDVRNREAEVDRVLSQSRNGRKTMCVGFILVARDLLRRGGTGLGIESQFVGSFFRPLGGAATATSNHAFLGLYLDGGILVGAELTTARLVRNEFMRRATAPRFDFVMPFTRSEQQLFQARNFGSDETPLGQRNHGDQQNNFRFSNQTLAEWKQEKTGELAPLDLEVTKRFDARAKWLDLQQG